MTSTKNIKVFDSIYGIIILFILLAIVSFLLAFAFEMIYPNQNLPTCNNLLVGFT